MYGSASLFSRYGEADVNGTLVRVQHHLEIRVECRVDGSPCYAMHKRKHSSSSSTCSRKSTLWLVLRTSNECLGNIAYPLGIGLTTR